MAMRPTFLLGPDETFVQCPYEKSHQISNQKYLVHLEKCRRNYVKRQAEAGKQPDIISCRFDTTHRYPRIEMQQHELHCPSQVSVVKHLQYHNGEEQKRKATEAQRQAQEPTRPVVQIDDEEEEEDWDKESGGYQAGYDPSEKLKNEPILYIPRGLTKSERKKWRIENRAKFATLAEMKPKLEDEEEEDEEDDEGYEDKRFDSSGRLVNDSAGPSGGHRYDAKIRRLN